MYAYDLNSSSFIMYQTIEPIVVLLVLCSIDLGSQIRHDTLTSIAKGSKDLRVPGQTQKPEGYSPSKKSFLL